MKLLHFISFSVLALAQSAGATTYHVVGATVTYAGGTWPGDSVFVSLGGSVYNGHDIDAYYQLTGDFGLHGPTGFCDDWMLVDRGAITITFTVEASNVSSSLPSFPTSGNVSKHFRLETISEVEFDWTSTVESESWYLTSGATNDADIVSTQDDHDWFPGPDSNAWQASDPCTVTFSGSWTPAGPFRYRTTSDAVPIPDESNVEDLLQSIVCEAPSHSNPVAIQFSLGRWEFRLVNIGTNIIQSGF